MFIVGGTEARVPGSVDRVCAGGCGAVLKISPETLRLGGAAAGTVRFLCLGCAAARFAGERIQVAMSAAQWREVEAYQRRN